MEANQKDSSPECCSPIHHFSRTVDAGSVIADVTPLLCELRPDWDPKRLKWEQLTGGYVNTMLYVHMETDTEMKDAVVVRIYGKAGDILISRDREFLAMQVAYEAGCFPEVFASFENGVLYRYAQGRMMTQRDYFKPEVIRAVTRKLFRLHDIDVQSLTLWDRRGQHAKFSTTPDTVRKLDRLIASIPASAQDPEQEPTFQRYRQALSDSVLKNERDHMVDVLEKLQMPVCISHANCNNRNLLLDERTGDVTIVDWETAAFHYRARDIAYYIFNHKVYTDLMRATSPEDPDVTPEVRDLWLRSYLEALYERHGRDPSHIRDADLELLSIEHKIMQVFGSLEFMVMGLAYVNLDVDIDFLKRTPVAEQRYFSMKPLVPGLIAKYLSLRDDNLSVLAAFR